MPTPQELVSWMMIAYPREKVPEAVLGIYASELADVDAAVLERAVRRLVRTVEFFPTIRAIREQAAELLLALPTEAEALVQISVRQEWARAAAGSERPDVHQLVHAAVDAVGGWAALRVAEKPDVIRGQLLRVYRDSRAAAIREAQAGDLRLAPARASIPIR